MKLYKLFNQKVAWGDRRKWGALLGVCVKRSVALYPMGEAACMTQAG